MKKLFYMIIEPLKSFANRNFSEKFSVIYHKNKWIAYMVSLLITVVILTLAYVIPNL
ncbi:MAG: hypothetical protein KKH01_01590 [Firmicutes bacterium]|nr:hypothetical protein [Bacillota bacterium]